MIKFDCNFTKNKHNPMDIYIEQTTNPSIMKFVAPKIITKKGYEYKNIEEAKASPLAQKLFQFPFVYKVIVSTNMVAIEKTAGVDWEDVANDLKIIINEFYQKEEIVIELEDEKKVTYSLYVEITPNPNAMKFVGNRMFFDGLMEYKTQDDARPNTLAKKIFELPFVKEILITDHHISIVKTDIVDWNDVAMDTREFILEYLNSGKPLFGDETQVINSNATIKEKQAKGYTDIEAQIKLILEEHVKPAVANDGGNIELVEFVEETKTAIMLLQGACSGCPSSTMTLKNGIETMLKDMMPGVVENVEALNG